MKDVPTAKHVTKNEPNNSHFKNIGTKISSFEGLKQSKRFLSIESMYIALLLFLILGMVHVPIALRFVCIGCSFFTKWMLRILCPAILFIGYFFIFDIPSEGVIIYSAMLVVSIFIMEYQKSRTKDPKNTFYLFLFSMAAMAMLDFLSGFFIYGMKATYIGGDGFPVCFLRILTIFMLVSFFKVLHIFIKSTKICGFISYGLFFFLGTINYWVMEITNSEFLLSDLKLIKIAASVIGEVQIEPISIKKYAVFLVMGLLFFTFLFLLPITTEEKKDRRSSGFRAILLLVISMLVLRSSMIDYVNYYGSVKYGVLCNLVVSMKSFEEPSGYEIYLDEIRKTEAAYQKNKESDSVLPTKDTDNTSPNIIVIMSEAFSDLSVVNDFTTNKDYMPYTRSILDAYPSGTLYASVRGNNTVSSEMEFLTGIPTGLSVKGSDFYQLYLDETEDSIVSLLKEQAYHTIGIHPYASAGYNRKNAWDAFGFDETYFIEDFKGDRRIRNFVSDEAFYQNIIEKYEANKDDGSVFIYGISMQNHASYLSGYDGEIKITDTTSNGMKKSLDEFADVNEYLSLLYESDKALEEFLSYFETQEEETIIVFYGDHQPLIDVDFYSSLTGKSYYDFDINEQSKVYEIPYFIWSNDELHMDVPDKMSINYLPNTVLDAAGLKKNAWFTFSDKVFKKYPVITDHFIEINNTFVEKETILDALNQMKQVDKKDDLDLLKQYQVWSYERVR